MRSGPTFEPGDFGIGRLFQHVRDVVVVANARTERIVLWNECATEILGYSEAEALEMPLHALVPEELRELHRAGLARYQETGTGNLVEGGHQVELTALHKHGHTIPIELTLTKVPEQSPEGDHFALAIIRDISERKEAQKTALKLEEIARDRQRALELNDTIVQGLTVAKLAFENDQHELGLGAVTETLEKAQEIVSKLLSQREADEGPIKAGDLVVQPEDG